MIELYCHLLVKKEKKWRTCLYWSPISVLFDFRLPTYQRSLILPLPIKRKVKKKERKFFFLLLQGQITFLNLTRPLSSQPSACSPSLTSINLLCDLPIFLLAGSSMLSQDISNISIIDSLHLLKPSQLKFPFDLLFSILVSPSEKLFLTSHHSFPSLRQCRSL